MLKQGAKVNDATLVSSTSVWDGESEVMGLDKQEVALPQAQAVVLRIDKDQLLPTAPTCDGDLVFFKIGIQF